MKVVCIGFGVVARTLLPLMLRHGLCTAGEVSVLCDDAGHQAMAEALGFHFRRVTITQDNHRHEIGPRLQPSSLLLNLAVGVSSVALVALAQDHGAMYLDTCVEPWAGGYDHTDVEKTTNAWLRRQALARRGAGRPVAVLAHGANPGLVSHFLKQALLDMASAQGVDAPAEAAVGRSTAHSAWASLAQALDVRVVQVAERDTQADERACARHADAGVFASTWSPAGLLAELAQPAECGWGTHEGRPPVGARWAHHADSGELYLPRGPRRAVWSLRSWVPSQGEQQAFWITHHEALSIGALLTVPGPSAVAYRPTCYYAYRPCAHTAAGVRAWQAGKLTVPRLLTLTLSPMAQGFDELGVLVCTPRQRCWYGSTLHASQALKFLHHPSCGNATSVQVAAGVMGALAWMLRNPLAGVVEAEDMDHQAVLAVARPMLGQLRAVFTDWHPGGELQWKDFLTNKHSLEARDEDFFRDDAL